MIQPNQKFASNNGNGVKVSAIISKRPPSAPVNKIRDIDVLRSGNMEEGVAHEYVNAFKVDETGYYHISTQVALRLTGSQSVGLDYMQLGVCDDKLANTTEHFVSRIMSSEVEPNHVICDNMTCVMKLEGGKLYTAWCNIGSDNNSSFEIVKEFTHLRLYKL
jgi:hypothetical protein